MNTEDDKLKQIESQLQRINDSLSTLRLIVAALVVIVIGLLFAMQEIRRDIPQSVLLAVGVVAVFVVVTMMASKRGPQKKSWEEKQD